MKDSLASLLLKVVLTLRSGVRSFPVINASKRMSGSPFSIFNGSRHLSKLHTGWSGCGSQVVHQYSSVYRSLHYTRYHARGVLKDPPSYLTQKDQNLGVKRHQSFPLSALSALRGGGSDNATVRVRLPPSFNQVRNDDVSTAILAVLASCRVTRLLQPTGCVPNIKDAGSHSSNITTISKQDASPVTVGDFASQAMALKVLHERFPFDMYIAEEGSEALRRDADLLGKVWNSVKLASSSIESICSWKSRDELLTCIDLGQGVCLSSNEIDPNLSHRRVWCLDPIDGTKGFLRGRIGGGQYCIALALLEDGVPVVSVLGCPNQPFYSCRTSKLTANRAAYGAWTEDEILEAEKISTGVDESQNLFSPNRGCIFVAMRGCGCYEISIRDIEHSLLDSSDSKGTEMWKQLHATPSQETRITPSSATFCLGVERDFSDPKGVVLKIAQLLQGEDALTTVDGIPDIKKCFRMDGQGKYGILARGEAEYFLRLPKAGYRDWVWDVAAGYLILTEAGGKMSDINGHQIDFSGIGVNRMAKLPEDVRGLLGSCGGVFHDSLLKAYVSAEGLK